MRAKKWIVLIFYIYLFLAFGYVSYSTYLTGGTWVIWGIVTISLGYQIVRFLTDKKKDKWSTSYIVADQRILGKIKSSLAISYVFILIFLTIGAIGIYQDFLVFEPFEMMVAAIMFSLLVFMISQIVQQFIN